MKSIKPGRGPMMMGGISNLLVALFGVFWTITVATMGAYIMIPFGLIFVALAGVRAVYAFRNATAKNRHSSFDIVDAKEEPDPLNKRFESSANGAPEQVGVRYCPSCGAKVDHDDRFCSNCGNEL
ncbi:MAG: zinc ribbon domain-containing protein [Clostridia bacterium]|nr:zinc ribbon domain-containing protein [Clostridia bacterium]